jgi:putative transposase
VRFGFIAAEKAAFPVRLLCRTLQVSRAGFYVWQARPPAPRTRADERLGLEIAAIHAESRQRYGSPRIHAELADRGCRTSRKRVARLMRRHGLAARRRRRFRVTTQSRHPFPIAANVLARQFERARPDQAWVTDITYIPTGEGWLYLAVILDLCSRFAVGWAMSERITDDLTLNALGMALTRRHPPQGLLHHSDRGSQPEWWMRVSGRGRRAASAMPSAASARLACKWSSIAQPITRRLNASSTTAKKANSSRSRT